MAPNRSIYETDEQHAAFLRVGGVTLHHGDCRTVIAGLPDASIDSIVTDPPYELGFMGKRWDVSGIAYDVGLWRECLRVLKPGGHLLAFGGTRTYHRMTVAIEDAGFEIRDSINWIYGSGFPKSLDVSKAIDKAAGAVGAIVGEKRFGKTSTGQGSGWNPNAVAASGRQEVRAPATDSARKWEGWGTALKPAHEPIVVARKPLIGTVAANVLTHGTGALNIDGCRVAAGDRFGGGAKATSGFVDGYEHDGWTAGSEQGRWPANVIHDGSDEVVGHFPNTAPSVSAARFFTSTPYTEGDEASFLYCSKAGTEERNAGLDHLNERSAGIKNSSGRGFSETDPHREIKARNFHPTVKPLALMRWLIRLVTPPGGTVLEPFAGSGTTLTAAVLERVNAVGIELTADYLPIIEGRIRWAIEHAAPGSSPKPRQTRLF